MSRAEETEWLCARTTHRRAVVRLVAAAQAFDAAVGRMEDGGSAAGLSTLLADLREATAAELEARMKVDNALAEVLAAREVGR